MTASVPEIRRRLATTGVALQTGRYSYRIKSDIDSVSDHLVHFYGDHELSLADRPFCDYHLYLWRTRSWKRLLAAQAKVGMEAGFQVDPFPIVQTPAYLEWGLNCCIYRNDHTQLLIHAAALERDGKAAIIVGRTGAGKSTLCAGLAVRGWRLLSDELAIVDPDGLTLSATARPVILKNQSLEIVRRLDAAADLGPCYQTLPKGLVAHLRARLADRQRVNETCLPGCIVFVNYQPDAALQPTPVTHGKTLMRLIEQTFNYSMFGPRGFELMCEIVERCPAYELTYSDLDEAIQWFSDTQRLFSETAADTVAATQS